MSLAKIFPDLKEKTEIWKKRVTDDNYYTEEEANSIIENFYKIGPPFIHESLNQREKYKIKISSFPPSSFYVIQSREYFTKTRITFDMEDNRSIVIMRDIQGTKVGEERNDTISIFLNEIINTAKRSNFSVFKLMRPEFTTNYYEHESTLKEMWSKSNPEEALKRIPTVFELHETELLHQDRMRNLYYKITWKSGFERAEKFFVYDLNG